ncbi:IclR family transcriptional regulator [Flavimaricola marinus]|uniref:Transcriptional regulator KdgR n=1 Tax=Flavimaricola marinus TaxID=1819565 RepID=A0A238LH43_9RHOB|nr:IclR family transcriptional regulator [Flavimaricola marinus]SMY08902.1 Transcriptional regulator KdgR [Flavimaricola marinus]
MDELETKLKQGLDDAAGKQTSSNSIGVLIKAFHVLEAMAELNDPAPLREIAKASELPKGTVYRVLQTLSALGYASQVSESGAYFLTSKLSQLGRNAHNEDIKTRLQGPMKRLHETFNETINLGILDAPYVNYVAVIQAKRALSWSVPAGTRDLFYCTALGRAIAAHLPEDQRNALIEQTTLTSRTPKTVMSREALRIILDEVRATGVSIDIEENDDGVVCIGAPVFLDDHVVASVSVSVPASRYTPELGEDIAKQLKEQELRLRTTDMG